MSTKKEAKKIVVISGGAGYLGSAIARKLSDSGFIVVIIAKNNKKNTEFINNRSVHYIAANITNMVSIEKIAKKIKNQFGKILAIIHAASAPLIRKAVLEETLKDFESQLSVNVTGAFNLFKSFCPIILPDGAIIGITSQAINSGVAHSPSGSYVPAKCALRGLLRILSNELKKQSIRVYDVAPAFMPGGLNRDIPKTAIEFIKKKSLPKEIADPEEVAETILDLVNNKNKIPNGKSITVPGRAITNL